MKDNHLILLLFSLLCLLLSTSVFSHPPDTDTYNSSGNSKAPSVDNAEVKLSTLVTTNTENTQVLAKINANMLYENYDQLTSLHSSQIETQQSQPIGIDLVVNPDVKAVTEKKLIRLRQLFLRAENALKNGDNKKYFLLADRLKKYPLYPYLQYEWLKKHLGNNHQVEHFLNTQQLSRYAPILKRKWLYHLAKHKRWKIFLQHYTNMHERVLSCYYRRAQFALNKKQLALKAATKLWAVGYSQPKECDPLFAKLKRSNFFTQNLRWKRFDAALRNNKIRLAIYVKKQMSVAYQATAQLWLNLYHNPARYIHVLLHSPKTAQSAQMFSHAIDRLATRDIDLAIALWDANKQKFKLDRKYAEKLEEHLALVLAYKGESGAYERFDQLKNLDESSREWRVRSALSEQNWGRVIAAIQALNRVQQKSERWQYWLARAYLKTGKVEQAERLFSVLAVKRSFYGFLAADRMDSMYQLVDNPIMVASDEITRLKNKKSFQIAYEFMSLGREQQAKLQWWYALKPLNKNEIMVAAKLAQQWHWDEIAIFTLAKIKYWNDIKMRFPLGYADKIYENAAQQKLNPAILFGLVRRESAFNKQAYSPTTGARGLMQILPGTGRQIARHFRERWRGSDSLYNPIRNLKYGSYYYQHLLKKFDGHYALALAAYNAGPGRVKQWLPDEALPADIWIETIPFKETREYVISVLAYTLIYQQRTDSNTLSMSELTKEVMPLSEKH